MSEMKNNITTARAAWGDELPAWVLLLAEACDRGSQKRASVVIGYSGPTVNQVLQNKYKGDYLAVEMAVRGSLERARVRCPSLPDELNMSSIPLSSCLDTQKRRLPWSGRWPEKERMPGCDLGCPNSLRVVKKSRAEGLDPAVVAANFGSMFPKATANLDRARAAWGADIPTWVELLATTCDEKSQKIVGRLIGYSAAVVNQVLQNKYKGNLSTVEIEVVRTFSRVKVQCPARLFGDGIALHRCVEMQRRPITSRNNNEPKRPTQCATCPNFRRPAAEVVNADL